MADNDDAGRRSRRGSGAAARRAVLAALHALAGVWPRIDVALYLMWCSLAIGLAAAVFVASMHTQTGGIWSAPLDDTFIHFDYARSFARGRAFEWSNGNGFSSGATSWLYPMLLAPGWALGFRELDLMQWALGVAVLSLFVFFLGAARLVSSSPAGHPLRVDAESSARPFGGAVKYLVPPAVLSLGALDWSLFSGMENALHLGVWGVAAIAWARAAGRARHGRIAVYRSALALGAASVLLVLTRPESIVCALVFAVSGAFACARVVPGALESRRLPLAFASISFGAPLGVLLLQALVTRALTGEWSAAGAITKLLTHDPYLPVSRMPAEYAGIFKYLVTRLVHYHFSDALPYGYIVPALGVVPFAIPRLRHVAATVWVQVLLWLAIVSFNTQARWQNERYVMSAAAWLLVLAVMGLGVLASHIGDTLRGRLAWGGRLAIAGLAAALYWGHQRPRLRDQIWFYGRACRNIHDQQVTVGEQLGRLTPKPHRVLVGDAGAILYASDLPGLDIIGLGGYRDYPFASAHRAGLGATIELIERMPPAERPDMMALYPEWWGEFPTVFGHRVAEVTVVGNVICGGPTKVIYTADWAPLENGSRPAITDGAVHDDLDVADLVSERAHDYDRGPRERGEISWRVLPATSDRARDVFDAGRAFPAGARESMRVGLPPDGGRVVVRTVTTVRFTLRASLDGKDLGVIEIIPAEGWSEASLPLPAGLPRAGRLSLIADHDWVDYHVWITR
ncbi:MAG: hypothetical protein U0271_03405 [Polyangiaceae bacterium]